MQEGFFDRRPTRQISVGNIKIGSDTPVSIQTMITEETSNTEGAVAQIKRLHLAGADIIRVTTPTLKDAQNLKAIKEGLKRKYHKDVPLVADVHHQGVDIAVEAARHVEKVRINPGLLVYHKPLGRRESFSQGEIDGQLEEIDNALRPIVAVCQDRGVALRVGVNHGSLAERLMVTHGDTPRGMVESAMEYLKILEGNGFYDSVVSLKASRVPTMIAANRLMVSRMEEEGMNYPLHLGVTEAGNGSYARTKSITGIAPLLSEGIGDTIRVSLAEDPINEIAVCNEILQSLGLKRTMMEFIACPGCGRTKFDLPTVSSVVKAATGHLQGLDIAVMGCIVNGPGEMADANYGYVGLAGGLIALYRGKERVRAVPQESALDAMISLIKDDGKWTEPPEGSSEQDAPTLNKRITFLES